MSAVSRTELAKAYDPKGVEPRWYAFWDERGFFTGPTGADGDPFCMVIPPPNITGALHIGHALNNTIQDTLIRRARMQGRPTLWVPGSDHAAIATQNVLERRLADEGLTRFDVGRDGLEERFWQWKDTYEARIIEQLKLLGCSCDWTRIRFTMDPGLSHAVRKVFVDLHAQKHIYRGHRIINWCPRCASAISDIEVNHIDTDGELVTLRYPLTDGSGYIAVSTTRVETMLGDTGVAVHPDDNRYTALVGKTVTLPLLGREIPIVADEAVDPEFGTGAVKVTPAHDPNDFEIAQRTGLPEVNIFDETAIVNAHGGRFAGLDRFAARAQVLEALKAEGVVEREERPYNHAVGHCDRCGTVIEPWLSEQWFVGMSELARPAIAAVRDGRVKIHPREPFERMYLDWMENIRDWCISRQLWLGHRIPAWYCPDGHTTVAMEDPDACATCGSAELTQDEDTLDTWFSSGLWPFTTLGWPEQTEDLAYWYPTSVLSTAKEILHLWVARMIFLGMHFVGDVPFRDVVIHPIVRDWQGRKMSKSIGNTIEPEEVIERYGTDAVRLSLLHGAVLGQDMSMAEDRIEGARHFCNKLWNASRFVLGHLQDFEPASGLPSDLGLAERWILSRLQATMREVNRALEEFEMSAAARTIQQFIRNDFCDWYVEIAKLSLGEDGGGAAQRAVLHHVLETSLRLAHPIMPFVTEEIWQMLPRREGDPESIMVAPWPDRDDLATLDEEAEAHLSFLQDVVVEIRRFRHEHKIEPSRRIDASVHAPAPWGDLVASHAEAIRLLARIGTLRVVDGGPDDGWSRVVAGPAEIYLPLGDIVDVGAERTRLEREIKDADAKAQTARKKLDNPKFTERAAPEAVEKARSQLAEAQDRITRLQAQLEELR